LARLRPTWRHVVPRRHQATRLPHESRNVHWHDSIKSHANLTGVTQRGQILEISFNPVHYSIFLKKGQNTKKKSPSTGLPGSIVPIVFSHMSDLDDPEVFY
jgi:hypothetical protein